jgi:glycosyltransferase involved in cell wall biosynthesis
MAMTPRRKLLFIALAFPPQNSSGTPRSTKFVKYLGEFGWEPIVVTLDWEKMLGRDQLDYSQMEELPPDLTVYRIEPFHPTFDLRELKRSHPQVSANLHELSGGGASATYTEIAAEESSRSWLYKMARSLYHFSLAPVGDEHFYWSLRALPDCIEIALRHQVAAIFVSVSPWTSAMLGLMLKKFLSVPLVVDFRDYWTLWPVKTRRIVRDKLDAYLERLILKAADRIVCVHQAMADDFARMEPRAADKCVVITNGYDPEDFHHKDTKDTKKRTTLAHVGMVWGDGAAAFLQALSRLKGREIEEKLQAHFIGGLPPSNLRFIRERGLDSVVTVEPRVPHREAVARMLQADVLLLLITSSEGGRKWYPGKLFEYLAAGKPVLAVAPPGIASRLIEEAGVGVTVDHSDGDRLEQMIRLAAENPEEFKGRCYQPRPAVIEKYNRASLTRRLTEVLDEVCLKE